MKTDELETLDLEDLQLLYDRSVEDFRNSLLRGTPWDQVQERRFQVSVVSIALYERLQLAHQNPAEYANR